MLNPFYIEGLLQKFDFVKWDRFVASSTSITFYGWIDRPQDSYKDFLVLDLYHNGSEPWFVTSDPNMEHERKIAKILTDDLSTYNHCQRVEYNYNIKNSIKLK